MRFRQHLFLLRLAILNTFVKKFRALLALGGIMLSSSIMVGLFGVGIGLQSLVTDQVAKSGSKDVVTVNQRNIQAVKLDAEKVSAIRSISGVGQVEELVGLVGTVSYHGISLSVPVYAVSEDYFSVSGEGSTGSGKSLPQLTGNNIVLSTKALDTFKSSGVDIGKKVSLTIDIPKDYALHQTSEMLTTRPNTFSVSSKVDRGELPVAYIPIEYARSQGVTSSSQLKVRLTDPNDMTAVRETIEQKGLQTTSIQDTIAQVNRIFNVIQQVIIIFGFIALVITIFGTFTVITMTLIEQTKQIGFLRLMGMQKRHVAFLFITQSIMLTIGGVVLGIVLGCIGGFALNGVAQALTSDTVFSESVYLFKVPYVQIIMMVMLSMVLGWLIGTIPAKRAVVIGPLEELHG